MLTDALTAPDRETIPFEGVDGYPDLDYEYGEGEFADSDDSNDGWVVGF